MNSGRERKATPRSLLTEAREKAEGGLSSRLSVYLIVVVLRLALLAAGLIATLWAVEVAQSDA
jgi:hypothetical protein